MGVVSPTGCGVNALWDAVRSGRSFLHTNSEGYMVGEVSQPIRQEIRSKLNPHPVIKIIEQRFPQSPLFDGHFFTLAAMQEAMQQAGWSGLSQDDGIIMASTTGQIPLWEQELIRFLKDEINEQELARTFRQQTLSMTLQQIICAMDFPGRATLITSACSASSQAMLLASKWLDQGLVKRVLVGSTELLCTLTLRGFESFQLLSSEIAKPFDLNRKGINLSEGAAFICLESEESDRALGCLAGGGMSADAYHMTSPDPNGRGCGRAMERALKAADLNVSDIDWIYAHGTGSIQNDAAESCAIRELFGNKVPVTSTKSIHGHALATSGILEAIIGIQALSNNVVLGNAHLQMQDEKLGIRTLNQNQTVSLRTILKNSLGFGGVNCSLVFCKPGKSVA